MSMPTFPEISPEITCEHSLNMILASIAMEELALSHIINAEGEKLQYVLGTLETGKCREATINEILAVNESVTGLLDSVSQNQILLKNKMDKVLRALSEKCPGHTDPYPGRPVCRCPSKCSAVFINPDGRQKWHEGCSLTWEMEDLHGECVRLDPCDNTMIELCPKGRYMVSFAVNVKAGKTCNESDITASLQMRNEHQCADIFIFHGHMSQANNTNTISMGGIIVEVPNNDGPFFLFLKLLSPDVLLVEDAVINVVEI